MIDKEKFEVMVDEFYEHKGLDKNGKPKAKTIKENKRKHTKITELERNWKKIKEIDASASDEVVKFKINQNIIVN